MSLISRSSTPRTPQVTEEWGATPGVLAALERTDLGQGALRHPSGDLLVLRRLHEVEAVGVSRDAVEPVALGQLLDDRRAVLRALEEGGGLLHDVRPDDCGGEIGRAS